jgi:hypothetical protein
MGLSGVWPQIKFAAGPPGFAVGKTLNNEKEEQHEKI